MDNNADAKQLIADRIRQATNILVTVETNPSVDELAAALAVTLMLNKLDKHATAVFSGAIPPAINFLEPGKTFENTVDSLRDFIIALDKEKADRLRYKVENDVVKIFITPYRSVITEKDLQFSQGDFNVEVVLALGVEKRESLDRAIAAHGRILHDATVITINARDEHSSLGAIDWQDGHASSICEMLVGLAELLGPKMLDTQVSTALLTGIVGATDRFSNKQTTPHVMTIAAELMAAGANQQLIANNLQQSSPKPPLPSTQEVAGEKIERKDEGEQALSKDSQKVAPKPSAEPADDSKGEMKVRHEKEKEEAPQTPSATKEESSAIPTVADELNDLKNAVQTAANETPKTPSVSQQAPPAQPTPRITPATPALPETPSTEEPKIAPLGKRLDESNERPNWQRLEPPTLGGTLNATTAEVEEEKRRQAEEEQNHNNVTLSHDAGAFQGTAFPPSEFSSPSTGVQNNALLGNTPSSTAVPTKAPAPIVMPPQPSTVPTVAAPSEPSTPPPAPAPAPPAASENKAPSPADSAAQQDRDLQAARQAVSEAFVEQPFNPSNEPLASVGSQPMPGDQSLHPEPPPTTQNQPSQPALAPPTPPLPPAAPMSAPGNGGLPPLPDFSKLPPLPPLPGATNPSGPMQPSPTPGADVTAQFAPPGQQTPGAPLPPATQPPAPPAPGQVSTNPNDPNQFRIPGQ